MCNHDDGLALLFVQAADRAQHLLPAVGVEHGGGLVEHQNVRRQGQHAGQRHALLLPAGERVRRAVFIACHVHGGERRGHARGDLVFRHAVVFQPEGNILTHDRGHELVVRVLKHHADFAPQRPAIGGVGSVHAVDGQRAVLQRQQGVEVLDERGFAAAVVPEHGHKLAGGNVQLRTVEGAAAARPVVGKSNVVCINHDRIAHTLYRVFDTSITKNDRRASPVGGCFFGKKPHNIQMLVPVDVRTLWRYNSSTNQKG